MKLKTVLAGILLGSWLTACQKNPHFLGKEIAARRLEKVLTDSTYVLMLGDTLVKDVMAEAVLFGIYGEQEIRSEAPYEVYSIKGHWVISGTLPLGWDGGTFEVIINAMDGRFIQVGHSR